MTEQYSKVLPKCLYCHKCRCGKLLSKAFKKLLLFQTSGRENICWWENIIFLKKIIQTTVSRLTFCSYCTPKFAHGCTPKVIFGPCLLLPPNCSLSITFSPRHVLILLLWPVAALATIYFPFVIVETTCVLEDVWLTSTSFSYNASQKMLHIMPFISVPLILHHITIIWKEKITDKAFWWYYINDQNKT